MRDQKADGTIHIVFLDRIADLYARIFIDIGQGILSIGNRFMMAKRHHRSCLGIALMPLIVKAYFISCDIQSQPTLKPT